MFDSRFLRTGFFAAVAVLLLAVPLLLTAGAARAQTPPCCTVPDNGTGTADLPPTCPPDGYRGHITMIDGLPEGTTLECMANLRDISLVSSEPGGYFGGTVDTFTGVLHLEIMGTGEFAGFHRNVDLDAYGVFHCDVRMPGDPVQEIQTDVYRLEADLAGDFDFKLLELEGGSVFLQPSPGWTTLTRLGPAGSDFAVDSFFDLHYRIMFEGNFYSELAQYRGITEGLNYVFEVCEEPIAVTRSTWGGVKALY
jgi:hypothetical protein